MQKHYLADIIEPAVQAVGFDVVRILTIGETNPVLQIMIEHKDDSKEVTVDDCAVASRAVSAILDEKDPIENRYTLEVSSPGLDRPLTKLEHFKRYTNYVIKLETVNPVEKRKRFKGILVSAADNGELTIKMEEETYQISFDNVAKAKIVLTDELWEKYLKSHKSEQA